jgi:hypothetical protein
LFNKAPKLEPQQPRLEPGDPEGRPLGQEIAVDGLRIVKKA